MEIHRDNIGCVFCSIQRIESGVMGRKRYGLFGKPAGVGWWMNFLDHRGERCCVQPDAKTSGLGLDVQRYIDDGPNIGFA